MSPPRRKVVVVQWARLGDIFHSRPLLEEARRMFPDSEIVLSCDARYACVAEMLPEVDRVVPINIGKTVARLRSDNELPDTLADLSASCDLGAIDAVFNLTNHPAAFLFSAALQANITRGYGHEGGDALAGFGTVPTVKDRHIAEAWLSLAKQSPVLRYPIALAPVGLSRVPAKVGIICDAGSNARNLSEAALRALVGVALKSGRTVTLFGASLNGQLCFDDCEGVRDLRGMTSLPDLENELRAHSIVVGPDTGALHFAAALGCKVFGIYLDGARPERTGPLTSDATIFMGREQTQEFIESLFKAFENWVAADEVRNTTESNNRDFATLGTTLSIIIPECAQTHYTDVLLDRLRQWCADRNCEIIVVSSCLDNIDRRLASERAGVRCYVAEDRLSFASSCNFGARMAAAEWLLFLNDDCEVTSESLNTLLHARQKSAIVGPRLRFWDGMLQSDGVLFDGKRVREATDSTRHGTRQAIVGVSGAAMLMHRDQFMKLGGFDESYVNGYEDVDLCLRAANLGVQSKVADCDVLHYRGSSTGRFDRDDANLSLFLSRWADKTSETDVSAQQQLSATPFLVVSDEPVNGSGMTVRWRSVLTRLGLNRGVDVQYICAGEVADKDWERLLSTAEKVVVFRSVADKGKREHLINWRKAHERLLIYDCDDIILDRFPEESIRAAKRFHFEQSVRELLHVADVVCVPNESSLVQFRGLDVESFILRTVPMAQHFATCRCDDRHETFNIGFAGSRAHGADFGIVDIAVTEILSQHENARFYWWGCRPERLRNHPQVRCGGTWVEDYAEHLQRIQSCPIDLWIVPLNDSPHNEARTPIKAFEYIGAKALCFFSAVEPYKSLLRGIADELLISNSTDAWCKAMNAVLDPAHRTRFSSSVKNARNILVTNVDGVDGYRHILAVASAGVKSVKECALIMQ